MGATPGGANLLITNCRVENYTIDNGYGAGGLIADSQEGITINYCITSGTLIDCNYGGGMVGGNIGGTINNSNAIVIIQNISANVNYVGGFVGNSLNGEYFNCSAEATITTSSFYIDSCGGFVGYSDTDIINKCFSKGSISLTDSGESYIGGFIGYSHAQTLTNCYSLVNVSAANYTAVGGFVGSLNGTSADTFKNSYSAGTVSGNTDVGGFIGQDASGVTIINSYSVGAVTGTTNVGGFIGICSDGINVSGCAWYTSASSYFLGNNGSGSHVTLMFPTYGKDEAVNTNFYSTTEVVYAQGGSNPWDFTSTWFAHTAQYPTFLNYGPVDGSGLCQYLSAGVVRKLVYSVSGAGQLNGQLSVVVGDGVVANPSPQVVSGGIVNLSVPAGTIHVGLPYKGTLQLLALSELVNGMPSQSMSRKVYDVVFKFWQSAGGAFGYPLNNLFPIVYNNQTINIIPVQTPALYTGDLNFDMESFFDKAWGPYIVQDEPLPLMILSGIFRSDLQADK